MLAMYICDRDFYNASGEAQRAKPKPLHLPPEQPMKKDLHSEIDALFSANIADPGVPDHEETQTME